MNLHSKKASLIANEHHVLLTSRAQPKSLVSQTNIKLGPLKEI